ncbi:hypothetical protein Tco_0326103, partial [Tanacetum coccineum]
FELKEVTEIGGAEFNASISKSCGWRKHSIFWNLPYWSTNLIRHNLDVMHIEKNIFENVFETVRDIEGKTKDNAKARDDVKIYCKRKELEKNESTGKYPKACYSLGKEEKKGFEYGKMCRYEKVQDVWYEKSRLSRLHATIDPNSVS